MKEKLRDIRTAIKSGKVPQYTVITGITAALLILLILFILLLPHTSNSNNTESNEEDTETIAETVTEEAEKTDTENTALVTEDIKTEREILSQLKELYAQNPDLAGWIRIDDTVIDYPVMHTPEDSEKYIYANFEGHFEVSGLPFMEGKCSMEPESDNLIIYAHNMKNGTMFASLLKYEKKEYWEEHPVISFSTLYEEREYEVLAAFYDRVYYKHEDCFKFYQFIEAEDEAHYKEAITYYHKNALYETGITAEYGDRLITLVTCAYHVDNGRFVVVAREKKATE